MPKLIVALMRDKPMPGKSALLNVSLDRRVEYALNCIDADDESKHQAVEFLRKVRDRLDNPRLQAKVEEVLNGVAP